MEIKNICILLVVIYNYTSDARTHERQNHISFRDNFCFALLGESKTVYSSSNMLWNKGRSIFYNCVRKFFKWKNSLVITFLKVFINCTVLQSALRARKSTLHAPAGQRIEILYSFIAPKDPYMANSVHSDLIILNYLPIFL
jgi:hypothetical protein